jgi:hypothetical protein
MDQGRVDFLQGLVIRAQPGIGAGPKIGDQDIGVPDQPVQDLDPARRFQVQRDALLRLVVQHEEAAFTALERHELPRIVAAAGCFYLDDLGAHFGQQGRTERPSEHPRKIDDPQAGKWRCFCLVGNCLLLRPGLQPMIPA